MNRRRVLSAIGGSATLISLSGCLGEDDEEESIGSTDDSNGATDDDPEALIDSADETLEEATEEFETALDEIDDPRNDGSSAIETGPIEARIGEGEDDLTAAREAASDDQIATIEALEDVAEFLRDLLDVFAKLGDAMNELETWERYTDHERWEDAITSAEQAESYNGDANDSATVARSTFDGIDTEELDDVDEVDRTEMEIALEEIEEVLDAIDVLITGSRQMTEGMIPLNDGVGAIEAEQFQTATSEFSAASNQFNSAYTTFNDAEDDAPAEFRSDFIDLSCQMSALRDATGYYASGAEAYENGNHSSGDGYFREGEAAADRCGENSDSYSTS